MIVNAQVEVSGMILLVSVVWVGVSSTTLRKSVNVPRVHDGMGLAVRQQRHASMDSNGMSSLICANAP
jgi:hypothetical protein